MKVWVGLGWLMEIGLVDRDWVGLMEIGLVDGDWIGLMEIGLG